MPVSPPTYAGTYGQSEQNTNAATICGYVDTANTAITTNKTAAATMCAIMKRQVFHSTGLLRVMKAIDDVAASLVSSP